MGEVIFCVLLAGGFLVPTALLKQWRLFWVFMTFFIIFGLEEWLSVAQTGNSISQHFWALKDANPIGAYSICGGMALGWAALIWHFLSKKKKE